MLNIPVTEYTLGKLKAPEEVFWWQEPAFLNFEFSGIYIICDKNDRVLYVGESQNVTIRLNDHRCGKVSTTKDFLEYFYRIEIFRADHFDRLINEIYFINKMKPILNTRHAIDNKCLMLNKQQYLTDRTVLQRSDIEQEAITSMCEPETQALIELLDFIKDEDFHYETHYFNAAQDWKEKYMELILDGIKDFSSLDKDEIIIQARTYAKALDDSLIPTNNIFHPDKYGKLQIFLQKIFLNKKDTYR